MIRTALSSSALIGAGIDQVLDMATAAGVHGVEWTADGFLEPGDIGAAGDAMMATLRAGLSTVSYATLFRAGLHDRAAFGKALATTRELNAPMLRLWAAPRGASAAGDNTTFIDVARSLGDEAGPLGITLCFGIERSTVLDSCRTAAALMSTIDHPFVKLAWEPLDGVGFDDLMEAFSSASGQVGLFSIRSEVTDRPSEEWLEFLDSFDEQAGSADMTRNIVIRSMAAGDADRLAACASSLKAWSTLLRRYHRRRIY